MQLNFISYRGQLLKPYKILLPVAFILFIMILPQASFAQTAVPKISIGIDKSNNPSDLVPTLQIIFLMTILTLAPSILMMMTSFTRIIIVFHFLRQSLATQTVPTNQILVGLALFMTFFIMKPVLVEINDNALQPYIKKEITQDEAMEKATGPIKAFMLKQTRAKDLKLFIDLRGGEKPKTAQDVSLGVLIPAFIISELKTAFQIGFLLYLPMFQHLDQLLQNP